MEPTAKPWRTEKLHIVVFPWLAFGHILPFFHLSKHLAAKGHRISFISAPRNLQRLPVIPPDLATLIRLASLPLPPDDNLPPNAEATTDVPFDKVPFLMKAYDGLRDPFARFLEAASPAVDWIIHDFNRWIPSVADGLGIRKAFFTLVNAWNILVVIPLPENSIQSDTNDKLVIERLRETKKTVTNTHGVGEVTLLTIKGCDLIIVRSCMEVEPELKALQLLSKIHGKPVVPLGLLPVSVDGAQEETWQAISGWLDKHEKGSVVYVALGSEVTLSQEQLTELAHGLELSGSPFLWALRKPAGSSGSVELPDGFERTRGRGLVWTSWAPQPRILAHDSVGAFLTHCGWSSVIEGLQFGRPLIMLPFVLDQLINAKDMEEKKLGIKIPRNDEDGSFTKSAVSETVKLLLHDEVGKIYRDGAKKMSEIVGDRKSSSQYLDKVEEYLRNNKPKREGY